MVQNHMLQMLMMTAMHMPEKISANEIRDEKRKVIEVCSPVKERRCNPKYYSRPISFRRDKWEKVVGYRNEPGIEAFLPK